MRAWHGGVARPAVPPARGHGRRCRRPGGADLADGGRRHPGAARARLLEQEIERFTVVEHDGVLVGCAALYPFGGQRRRACLPGRDAGVSPRRSWRPAPQAHRAARARAAPRAPVRLTTAPRTGSASAASARSAPRPAAAEARTLQLPASLQVFVKTYDASRDPKPRRKTSRCSPRSRSGAQRRGGVRRRFALALDHPSKALTGFTAQGLQCARAGRSLRTPGVRGRPRVLPTHGAWSCMNLASSACAHSDGLARFREQTPGAARDGERLSGGISGRRPVPSPDAMPGCPARAAPSRRNDERQTPTYMRCEPDPARHPVHRPGPPRALPQRARCWRSGLSARDRAGRLPRRGAQGACAGRARRSGRVSAHIDAHPWASSRSAMNTSSGSPMDRIADATVRRWSRAGGRAAHRWLWIYEDVTVARPTSMQLGGARRRDELTGLYNRRRFHEELGRMLADAERRGHRLGLPRLRSGRFQADQRLFGHQAGDEVLVRLAVELGAPCAATRRSSASAATVRPAGARGQHGACANSPTAWWRRWRDTLVFDGREAAGTASVGIARFPRQRARGRGLVAAADEALYRAKSEDASRSGVREAGRRIG